MLKSITAKININNKNIPICRSWKDEIECNKPRLMRAVFKAFWIEILKLGALGVLTDSIINLSVAIALGSFLTYFQYEIIFFFSLQHSSF